jgi:hypothetical protein
MDPPLPCARSLHSVPAGRHRTADPLAARRLDDRGAATWPSSTGWNPGDPEVPWAVRKALVNEKHQTLPPPPDWRSSCRSASSLSIAWHHYPGVLRDNEDQPEHHRRVSAGRAPPTGLEPVTLRLTIATRWPRSVDTTHQPGEPDEKDRALLPGAPAAEAARVTCTARARPLIRRSATAGLHTNSGVCDLVGLIANHLAELPVDGPKCVSIPTRPRR